MLMSVLAAGSLGGCSSEGDRSTATQDPTADACALAETRVVWEPTVQAQEAHLGHRLLTVRHDGTQERVDEHAPYSSVIQDAEGLAVGDEQVLEYLLDDFTATTQTDSDRVGNPPEDFDRVNVTEIAAGTYVMGY